MTPNYIPDDNSRDGIIYHNVKECPICGAPMDRYSNMIQCRANGEHKADLITGIVDPPYTAISK